MINSKYSSLPDIDTAPDLYETLDLIETDQLQLQSDQDDDDNDNDDEGNRLNQLKRIGISNNNNNQNNDDLIDKTRLNSIEARRRFNQAIQTNRLLPSTTYYSTTTSTDEKETNLERLRRLRLEVAELEDDLIKEQSTTDHNDVNSIITTSIKGKGRQITPAILLQQLHLLRNDLTTIFNQSSTLTNDDQSINTTSSSKLDQKLKSSTAFVKGQSSTSEDIESTSTKIDTVRTNKEVNQGELDSRLALIENLVGIREADVDASNPVPPPLLKTLQKLETLLSLLTQPRHLDTISRRIKVLVTDLERLQESRKKLGDTRALNVAIFSGGTTGIGGGITVVSNGGIGDDKKSRTTTTGLSTLSNTLAGGEELSPEVLNKINSLFNLLPRIDPLLPLTPKLLTRLRGLATLHSSTAEFSTTLSSLKSRVELLSETSIETKSVLERLEESITANEVVVKGNLTGLEERIRSVGERLGRLGM